ncbi:MAG: hypothetical protein ABW138_20110, partial [Candidatus Thiodiazotropha sp. 4PDIVS1]
MDLAEHTTDPRVVLFWSQYMDVLSLFRIPDKTSQWYRRHIKQFIDDHHDIRLRNHTAESLGKWLDRLAREPRISDRKFLVVTRLPDYSINTERCYL